MNPADLFRRDTNPVTLEAGEVLFREGETGDHMYVLLEGAVDILVGSKVVEVSSEGALIGEMALIDNFQRAATVVAKTPCRLTRIDSKRFHFLIQQNPFFATHVMKVLVERIRKVDQLLQQS